MVGPGLRGGLWDPRGLVGGESGDESVWMGASVSSFSCRSMETGRLLLGRRAHCWPENTRRHQAEMVPVLRAESRASVAPGWA